MNLKVGIEKVLDVDEPFGGQGFDLEGLDALEVHGCKGVDALILAVFGLAVLLGNIPRVVSRRTAEFFSVQSRKA